MKKILYEFKTFNESDLTSDFINSQMININEIMPLHTDHLRSVGIHMFNKNSHISIENWLMYSLYNDHIIGSRANLLKNMFDKNISCFNTCIGFGEKIEIYKEPLEVDNYDESFIEIEYNIYNWFVNKYSNLIKNLIKLKMLYGSFFLREIIHIVNFPYNISGDLFFENIKIFAEFARDFNITSDILSFVKTDFINDFNKLIKSEIIKTNYTLYHTDLFVNKIICNGDIPHGNLIYKSKLHIMQENPFPRSILIYTDPEPYMSNYELYIHKYLKLYSDSIYSKILKRIYKFLIESHNIPSYITERSKKGLINLKEKIIIQNNEIFFENHHLFLTNSTQAIKNIKNRCFKRKIKTFYIYNIQSCKMELIKTHPRIKEGSILLIEF